MAEHRFSLQRPSSRHTCPQCGKRREFTRYVDVVTGEMLPEHVGKCNRADNCGYHLPPRDYFRETGERPADVETTYQPKHAEPRPIFQHSRADVLSTVGAPDRNTLSVHFQPVIDAAYGSGRWAAVCKAYALGTVADGPLAGAAVFWQATVHGQVRAGKVMLYDPASGKRRKDVRSQSWMHYEQYQRNAGDLNVNQCLFGEHLLAKHPEAVVAVVESEKTALIAAACVPTMVWLATGSLSEFKLRKLEALTGRHVIAFPDLSIESKAYKQWSATAYELRALFASIHVSDLLEAGATVESTLAGEDIADRLLREAVPTTTTRHTPKLPERILSEAEKALKRLSENNPAVGALAALLDLDPKNAVITRRTTASHAA